MHLCQRNVPFALAVRSSTPPISFRSFAPIMQPTPMRLPACSHLHFSPPWCPFLSRHFFRPCSCSVPTKKVTHGKAQEEAGLANAGISDEYKLEEVVVIPLPPGGLGRGGWGHRCLCYGLWFVGRSVASSVGYCWGVVGLLGLCEFSWLLFRKIMPSSCRHRVVVHRHRIAIASAHRIGTVAQSKSKTTAHGNDGETGICYAYLILVQNSRRAK